MRPRLILRLTSDPEVPLHWVGLDSQGRPEGDSRSGSLQDAAEAARGRAVLALAPGADCLLTGVHIPTQSRQRLARAVPYALEDQLTDDVEDLHFALGDRDTDGRLRVAVVGREDLQGWLDAAGSAGLEPEQVFPEILALPRAANAWTVLVEPYRFLVRTGAQDGFAGDLHNLAPLLEAALAEAGDGGPERLIVYEAYAPRSEPRETGRLVYGGALPTDTDLEIEHHSVDDPTRFLAEQLDPGRIIDLRRGAFARDRALRVHWQRWRAAAVLLATLTVLGTGRAWYEQWQLATESEHLQTRITEVYQSVFPGRAPTYPREQMARRLEDLRGGDTGGDGFLGLLERVAPAIDGAEGIDLRGISFRGDRLELEVYTGSLQRIDDLERTLGGIEGIRVEVRSARSDGDRVRGRLHVEAT